MASTHAAERYSIYSQLQEEDGLKMVDQALPGTESCKVLDLGCGTGYLSNILADRVGPGGSVIGVDPDKERIRVAQEKYSAGNLTFLKSSSEDYPEDQYDLIFANYVLHWIKDKESLFENVQRNLKPGGRFAFTVPEKLASWQVQLSDLMGPDISRRIKEETYSFVPFEEYEKMAKRYGFSVDFKVIRDTMSFQNIKTMMDWWFAANSYVDDLELDPVNLARFVQPFGEKPVEFEVCIAIFILIKQ